MCRMAGFSSKNGIKIFQLMELISSVKHMAQFGLEAPHKDGWGIAAFSDIDKILYKSVRPIYEDDYIFCPHITSIPTSISNQNYKIGIIHARLASEGLPKTTLQLHPFYINGKYFSHNGTIKSALRKNIYDSDTFEYFENISSFNSLIELAELVDAYGKKNDYSGMNFLMIDEIKNVLYVCCFYKPSAKNEKYYTLYYHCLNDTFIVYSEKINADLLPMSNGEIFKVANGQIVDRIIIPV